MIHFFREQMLMKGLILAALFCVLSCSRQRSPNDQHTSAGEEVTADSTVKPLTRVRFMPYWVVTAQFAGYYTGVERGIYRKYGIDLEIVPFLPFVTSYDQMRDTTITFAAIWLANAIELKASGLNIVNIAQPSTQSSLMLITKKSSNISSIKAMDGKKAGIWEGYEFQPNALFRKHGVDVKIIPIGSTNNLFLKGGVDITIANWFDEYHTITNSGLEAHEMNAFFFKDYGLNFLEDGIYCLDSVRKADPAICKAFIQATFESWEYAFGHPEEAISIVLDYARQAKQPANAVHQRWMIDRYKDLYMPPGRKAINTNLSQKDYAAVGNLLLEQGVIDTLPLFSVFFKPIIED